MASNTNNLLFLASILLVCTLSNAVSDADVALVCSKTKEPDFCQRTLKSDISWSSTNFHGLAEISLRKATDQAKYMPQYLGSVSARAEPELAAKYAACSKDYETVIAKLNEADRSFRGAQVAVASQAVNAAFDQISTSLGRFSQPPKDLSQFTDYCLDIQTLCQAFVAAASH